jgi:NAD(P)-dependent dehydrogenase (short-subunit alcohol dehydrogenase family)
VEHFGRIDVVVNNAGYGQIGTLEELTDEETRENYAVNVFGTLNVIRNVLPYLREQKSGNIFNISSVGGYSANFPGWGIYCSTKFAVAGFTEALARRSKRFRNLCYCCLSRLFPHRLLTKDSVKTPANPIQAYEAARISSRPHLNESMVISLMIRKKQQMY